jgi:hypothetical protein
VCRQTGIEYPVLLVSVAPLVDRNASTTKPAKFPLLLVKDKGAPALVPAP